MNLALLLLLIGIIICFLEEPFVVIWMQDFSFIVPLMMLLIWFIFFVPIEENASLILTTLEVLAFCLETWAYNMVDFLGLVADLLFLKYFEMTLISFWDLAGIGKGIFSMFARMCLMDFLLFLLGIRAILGVNFDVIFFLSEFDWLSV